MPNLWKRLTERTPTDTREIVPVEYQKHFHHLFGDMAWYGLVAGSTIAFLSVYAARLGASALQIGLLTAGPALVNLVFTLPTGAWLRNRPIGVAVFRSAVAFRFLYLIYALLPLLLAPVVQIEVLVWATLIFTIPGVALAIGFNALFAITVPPEWRGYVAGRRNALISVVYVVTSLLSGFVLNNTSLEVGYTIIFGLGFVGATMSSYHLSRLRDIRELPGEEPQRIREMLGDAARPGGIRGGQGIGDRTSVALRGFTRGKNLLRVEVLRGGYGVVLLALFTFHTAQYMPAALFPLRWVDQLHFNDGQIALGTAVFHSSVLLGSLRFGWLTRKYGSHKLLVAGTGLLSTYPLFTAFMPNLFFYLATSFIGGLAWALAGGALANYLLEKVPPSDRPAHLAWYNLALNGAILLGALLGPLFAGLFSIQLALVLAFALRLTGSVFIWFADRATRRPIAEVEGT